MNEQERNLATIKNFYQHVAAGDFDKVVDLVTPDFVIYEAEGMPYGGEYRGMTGYLDLMQKIFGTWVGMGWEVIEWLSGGPYVAVYIRNTGTHYQSGMAWDMTTVEMWKLADGKVVEARIHYFDSAAVRRTAGLSGLEAKAAR